MTIVAGMESAPPAPGRVIQALDSVRDPELDEPVTSLGFVASCTVSGEGAVDVHLRLPTFFCAPNFAFLMTADAYDAVSSLPGVRSTVVTLDDHFASETINAGVAAQAGFRESFGDQAGGELDTLRTDFVRKAVLAGTDRVCSPLLSSGTTPAQLAAMTLADLTPSKDVDRLRARRREIGLPADDASPLLVDASTGAGVGPAELRMHLGRARLSRVNIEANGSMCRGMLRSRYGVETAADDEETS